MAKHHSRHGLRTIVRSFPARTRLTMGIYVLVAVSIAAIFYFIYTTKALSPQAATVLQETTKITNQAVAEYCTTEDEAATCDPSANRYSQRKSSNTVETTIEGAAPAPVPDTSSICIEQLRLKNRQDNNNIHNKISLTVKKTDGSTVAQFDQIGKSDAAGTVRFTLTPNILLSNDIAYTVLIKPVGYFQRKIGNVQNILNTCVKLVVGSHDFILGDLAGNDGKATLADIVAAIKAYNGTYDAVTQEVFLGKPATLADIVATIRALNEKIQDEN